MSARSTRSLCRDPGISKVKRVFHVFRESGYNLPVIVSFGDAATEDVFHGRRSKRARGFPEGLIPTARRKLDMLNAASQLEDLRKPPGNRLEGLKGDLKGRHSIRVNDRWRIVFRWTEGGPAEVVLTDYH